MPGVHEFSSSGSSSSSIGALAAAAPHACSNDAETHFLVPREHKARSNSLVHGHNHDGTRTRSGSLTQHTVAGLSPSASTSTLGSIGVNADCRRSVVCATTEAANTPTATADTPMAPPTPTASTSSLGAMAACAAAHELGHQGPEQSNYVLMQLGCTPGAASRHMQSSACPFHSPDNPSLVTADGKRGDELPRYTDTGIYYPPSLASARSARSAPVLGRPRSHTCPVHSFDPPSPRPAKALFPCLASSQSACKCTCPDASHHQHQQPRRKLHVFGRKRSNSTPTKSSHAITQRASVSSASSPSAAAAAKIRAVHSAGLTAHDSASNRIRCYHERRTRQATTAPSVPLPLPLPVEDAARSDANRAPAVAMPTNLCNTTYVDLKVGTSARTPALTPVPESSRYKRFFFSRMFSH